MQESFPAQSENHRLTLIVVIAMSFMATLDSSIVNVALPVMSDNLAVPVSSIEWVIASYSIIICSTLLFFGRLGDLIGKTKVFQWGTIVFTFGSLMCGLCNSLIPLVICRFIQGVGASAYMANNHGIITEITPRAKRGKALGILGAAVALGTMIGPPAGGLIVSLFNWNYIFLINVPIGIIVFLMGQRYLPKSHKVSEKMDVKGAILQFSATVLFFGAFIEAQRIGMGHLIILAAILVSIVLLLLFIRHEKRIEQPLLQLQIFKSKLFSMSLVCALISFVCIAASAILLPFYFQNTMKLTPAQTGILLMLSPLIIAALSPVCGAFSDRIGAELLTLIGLICMSGGFFLMSLLDEHSALALAAIYISVMAIGQAMFQPANNSLVMSSCPRDKLGIAGSINSLVRNLGLITGITLSTTILYSFMSLKLKYKVSDYVFGRDDVFVFGMKYDYKILAIICCIGAMLTGYRFIISKRYDR